MENKSIKEIVGQLLGKGSKTSLLSGEVVRASIFGPDVPVSVTAIVTSRHQDGFVTVYVPTAPIPASGITYHLPESCIEVLEGVTVEEAMRTIIACGAGSNELFARNKGLE